ncbi:hypothetical protein VNO77_42504 [Canavalia gladiata]|uniref:C2H2-type domain-containing protein n=1 Tax=Canavalia gladiata TaxID=3824 RepID=A0AAN9JSE2_CANGL
MVFICNECGELFETQQELGVHTIERHHPEYMQPNATPIHFNTILIRESSSMKPTVTSIHPNHTLVRPVHCSTCHGWNHCTILFRPHALPPFHHNQYTSSPHL